MKILAIDHGTKRLGVAVSDELGITAKALPVISIKNQGEAINKTLELVDESSCALVLVGIPLAYHGENSTQTDIVRDFIEKLKSRIRIPIIEWDETYSSKQANQSLLNRKKKHIDSESAKLILIEYLNSDLYRIDPHHDNRYNN